MTQPLNSVIIWRNRSSRHSHIVSLLSRWTSTWQLLATIVATIVVAEVETIIRGGRHLKPAFDTEEYCEGCQKRGHIVEECPIKCNYCKEHGHVIDNCFKRKWVNEQRFSKREDDNGDNGKKEFPYNPSFQRANYA
jgi:Arginine methyltransferase-interacting protein, contains RING Zn-finger